MGSLPLAPAGKPTSSIFSLKKKKVSDRPLSQGYYKIKLRCLCVLKTPWQNIRCCCWVTSVVSDSVRPHRWQPTRLPRPWDSPGKNTGVGCHFLLELGATQIQESLNMNPVVHFQGKGTDAVNVGLVLPAACSGPFSVSPMPLLSVAPGLPSPGSGVRSALTEQSQWHWGSSSRLLRRQQGNPSEATGDKEPLTHSTLLLNLN